MMNGVQGGKYELVLISTGPDHLWFRQMTELRACSSLLVVGFEKFLWKKWHFLLGSSSKESAAALGVQWP
jgi:hypothetical protein